ncbi:hypothetical protein AALB64_15235 [Lachnospiraceae bacterium 45-P1]
MKKILLLAATISLSTYMGLTAFAGEWKQDANGYQYVNDNGELFYNGWQWIDGNNDGIAESYYFNETGYCLLNTTTPDGFVVNSDGAWAIDGIVQTKSIRTEEPVSTQTEAPTSTNSTNTSSQETVNVGDTVYLPASGEKYHKIPNCGKMNPDKARAVSVSDAIKRGYQPCTKCY